MNNPLRLIRKFLNEGHIEIVSYGLAPNPFGFCFEILNDELTDKTLKTISEAFDYLSNEEEELLRKQYLWLNQWTFGKDHMMVNGQFA